MILLVTTSVSAQDTVSHTRKPGWYVPDFATLQYAGSIGMFAGGGGYSIFHDKATVELLFGFVPGSVGNAPLETITLKFTAAPWKVRFNQGITWQPLTMGTYFCYTPGREFSSDLPSWYPDGYYWWSEAVRVNIFIGGSASIRTDRLRHISRLDLYYELGTNEIKLVSYVQNPDYLSVGKIIHAGVGLRVHFRKD